MTRLSKRVDRVATARNSVPPCRLVQNLPLQPILRCVFDRQIVYLDVRHNLIAFKQRLPTPAGRGRSFGLCDVRFMREALGVAAHRHRRIDVEAQRELADDSRSSR